MLNLIQTRMISNKELKVRMATNEQGLRDQRERIKTWGPKIVEEQHSNPDVKMDEKLRPNQFIENKRSAGSIARELQLHNGKRSE